MLVPWEHFDLVLFPEAGQLGDAQRQALVEAAADRSVFDCPNCGRLLREEGDDLIAYTRESGPPRVWADLADRDPLGRVRLRSPRSQEDIRRQRLLLSPSLPLVVHDDDHDCPGVVETESASEKGADVSWVVNISEEHR